MMSHIVPKLYHIQVTVPPLTFSRHRSSEGTSTQSAYYPRRQMSRGATLRPLPAMKTAVA